MTSQQEMLDEIAAVKADAAATSEQLGGVATSLVGLQADVTSLKALLPATGGMTADEVATVKAALDDLSASVATAKGQAQGVAATAADLDAQT